MSNVEVIVFLAAVIAAILAAVDIIRSSAQDLTAIGMLILGIAVAFWVWT